MNNVKVSKDILEVDVFFFLDNNEFIVSTGLVPTMQC